MTPWVVLIGPPGAGVTSTAREVAAMRGLGWVDSEREAARALGYEDVSIAFVVAGAQRFAQAEESAALSALAHDGVVALGSAALDSPGVREAVRHLALVQLTVSLAHAAPRLGLATARPVFLGNPRAQWSRLAAERAQTYDAVARAAVDTDDLTPAQVAARVIELMEET